MSNDVLAAPGVRAQLWPLSVEAYHALGEAGLIPEKTELLNGLVFKKMPKSPLHCYLRSQLHKQIQPPAVMANFFVGIDQPITGAHSEPEPDVAVIVGHERDFRERHPTTAELTVEIAVSSEELDREKASIYAAAGVKEYWIVLAPETAIEIYRRPKDGAYQEKIRVVAGEVAAAQSVPGFAVDVTELFAK